MKVFRLLLAVITTASLASSKGKPLANALVSLHHILKDNMDGLDNEKLSITSNSRGRKDTTSKQIRSKCIPNAYLPYYMKFKRENILIELTLQSCWLEGVWVVKKKGRGNLHIPFFSFIFNFRPIYKNKQKYR